MTPHSSRGADLAYAVGTLVRGSAGLLGVALVVIGVGLTTGSCGAAVLAAGVLLVVDRVTDSLANR